MPDLGQVIGALIASISHARRIADEETVAIAEYYQTNPLLAGMSVPRVRIPEVSLELPILIEAVAEGTAPTLQASNKIVGAILGTLGTRSLGLAAEQRKRLRDALREHLPSGLGILQRRPLGVVTREEVALVVEKAFVDSATAAGLQPQPGLRQADIKLQGWLKETSDDLKQVAREVAFAKPAVRPTIQAQVLTFQVKEQSSPANVARLRLIVREEGLEWNVIERSDGTTRSALSPE